MVFVGTRTTASEEGLNWQGTKTTGSGRVVGWSLLGLELRPLKRVFTGKELKLRALGGKGEMVCKGTKTTGSGRGSLLARE